MVFPPLPGLYRKPASIEEMVDHTVGLVIDLFGLEHGLAPCWGGMKASTDAG